LEPPQRNLCDNGNIRHRSTQIKRGEIPVKGFDGDVAAFEITGKLNRQDFGLRWNAMTEAGGVVVSDEVKLDIAVELKTAEVNELVEA
jgi:hypothetical protein